MPRTLRQGDIALAGLIARSEASAQWRLLFWTVHVATALALALVLSRAGMRLRNSAAALALAFVQSHAAFGVFLDVGRRSWVVRRRGLIRRLFAACGQTQPGGSRQRPFGPTRGRGRWGGCHGERLGRDRKGPTTLAFRYRCSLPGLAGLRRAVGGPISADETGIAASQGFQVAQAADFSLIAAGAAVRRDQGTHGGGFLLKHLTPCLCTPQQMDSRGFRRGSLWMPILFRGPTHPPGAGGSRSAIARSFQAIVPRKRENHHKLCCNQPQWGNPAGILPPKWTRWRSARRPRESRSEEKISSIQSLSLT